MSEAREVKLRVTLVQPPAGVMFCLQRRRAELVDAVVADGSDVTFQWTMKAEPGADGGVRLLGPMSQGPPGGRFIYVCIGAYAGQVGTTWARRAKIPLAGITWEMVEAAGDGFLEAAYEGTDSKGGPACATVRFTKGWKVA
jgi:hypothetical protein